MLISMVGLVLIFIALSAERGQTSAVLYENGSIGLSETVVKGVTSMLVEATSGEDAEMAIEPYDYDVYAPWPEAPTSAKGEKAARATESGHSADVKPDSRLSTLKTMDTLKQVETQHRPD